MPSTPGPASYLIFRDPNFVDGDAIVSVTSEGGRVLGPVVPGEDNQGVLVGLQEGTPTGDTPREAYFLGGGMGGQGGWLLRAQGEASTAWRGMNALTALWRPAAWTVSAKLYAQDIACAGAYLVAAWVDSGGVRINRQSATDPLGTWDALTISTSGESTDSSTEGGIGICTLPDGSLFCAYQQQDSTTGYLNINAYSSTDYGASWSLVQRRILTKTSIGVLPSSGGQYQIRSSGDWIRILFNSTSIAGAGIGLCVQKTIVSSDRGASWSVLANITTYSWKSLVGYVGSAPTAMVGIGDSSGTFLLAYLSSLASSTLKMAVGQRDQDWENVADLDFDCSSYATTPHIKGVCMVKDSDRIWLWVWVEGTDKSEFITRICTDPTDPTNANNWVTLGQTTGFGGVLMYAPHCWRAAWTGDRIVMTGGVQDPTTAAASDPVVVGVWMAQAGSWDQRPWDYSQLDVSHHDYLLNGGALLLQYQWSSCLGTPTQDALTPWTLSSAGAPSIVWAADKLTLSSTAITTVARYNLNLGVPSSLDRWGSTSSPRGFAFHFSCAVTGSRILPSAGTDCGIRIFAIDGTGAAGYQFTIRIGPTQIVVYDEFAAAIKVTITTTDFASRCELRVWGRGASWGISRKLITSADGAWTDSGPYTMTNGALAFQGFAMGILAAVGAGTGSVMELYDLGISYQTDASQRADAISKPTQLMGAKINRGPVRVSTSTFLRWGGSGAFSGDQYTASLYYQRGRQNLVIDSPRSYWESSDLALQSLVLKAQGGGGLAYQMNALLLVGTVDRTATIEFNTSDSWGAPAVSESISADLFTGLTVTAVQGSMVTVTKSGVWPRKGSLIGCYIRFLTGAIAGQTFKILSDTGSAGRIQVADGFNLASLGVLANDTAVIFGDRMVWKSDTLREYGYFRIVFPNLSTVTRGTYTGTHRIGGMVPGFYQELTVPLEWSFRDNEQPNVTSLRTRGGATWQYLEGPPQRIVDGRFVGDVNEFRGSLRDMLRELQDYSVCPIGFVMDESGIPSRENVIYGRVTSGAQNDNAAWYTDADENWRMAGDMDLVVTEEV